MHMHNAENAGDSVSINLLLQHQAVLAVSANVQSIKSECQQMMVSDYHVMFAA